MPDDEMFIRWQHVRVDELMALHRVAMEARDAVQIAEAVGVHLGPLRAALDATAYRVSSPFTAEYTALVAERDARDAGNGPVTE